MEDDLYSLNSVEATLWEALLNFSSGGCIISCRQASHILWLLEVEGMRLSLGSLHQCSGNANKRRFSLKLTGTFPSKG